MQIIQVEVAFAAPETQKIISLDVPKGTTAKEAVKLSGIADYFTNYSVLDAPMGIFSNMLGVRGLAAADAYEVKQGERVEVYRPLIADPKEVRKKRALESAQRRAAEKDNAV